MTQDHVTGDNLRADLAEAPAETMWQAIEIVPYGAVLHVPADWEAMPPVPANGPEILRATGGPGLNLIVFKIPARGMTADQVADEAETKLAAHGYDGFTRRAAPFAGHEGVALDFEVRTGTGVLLQQTREYFAVRGHAGYVLGMGSRDWDTQVGLIEEIARRFELIGGPPAAENQAAIDQAEADRAEAG